MDRNRTLPCPECGLPNIIERSICKRCRAPLRPETTAPILPRVYTDITGMLYLAEGYLLGIYPHMLTYETDGYFFEVPWDKTRRIQHDRHGQYVLALGLWAASGRRQPPHNRLPCHHADSTFPLRLPAQRRA